MNGSRPPRRIERRPEGPAAVPARIAGLGIVLALAAGCAGSREGASPRPMIDGRTPADTNPLPAVPEFVPRAVGKPYRDLRRHTALPIGDVSGIDASPDGSVILFAGTGDGPTPNLYLKRETGAGLVRKTSGPSWDIQPRFSPDGLWIAFASNRDGNFDVWIIPAEGAGGAEQATSSTDDEVHPAWSPDGKKIAYSRLSAKLGWTIWVLHREDGTAVELGPGLFPDWSPTGEWIAFQKPSEVPPHRFGLWLTRPDGSEVRQVVAGDSFSAVEPAWSPTGEVLAFTAVKEIPSDARKSDGGAIWLVEMAHGRMYQLTDGPTGDCSPVWGLNGRITFVSDRLGGRSIWSLEPPEVNG